MGFTNGSDSDKDSLGQKGPRVNWLEHFKSCGLNPDRAFVTAWRHAVKVQGGYPAVIESLQEQGLTLPTVLIGKVEINLAERVDGWVTSMANDFRKKFPGKLPSVGGKGRPTGNKFEGLADEFADLLG